MKEQTMWNLLLYLFSNQLIQDDQLEEVKDELEKISKRPLTHGSVMRQAVLWLQEYLGGKFPDTQKPDVHSFRVLSFEEQQIIDEPAWATLLRLEQQDILTPYYRELVITKLLEISDSLVDLALIQWVALMVLLQHDEEERAVSCMQLIALDDTESGID